MATCPSCGANSRSDPGFVVETVLKTKPWGAYSLDGVQVKVVVTPGLVLRHSCGWNIEGRIEDGYFVPDQEDTDG